jgi:hypothetical protein
VQAEKERFLGWGDYVKQQGCAFKEQLKGTNFGNMGTC